MKPFNLKEALEGKPVITRDGTKITSLHHFGESKTLYCVYAHLEGNVGVDGFTINGKWNDEITNHDLDLFMADEERWVNVYWDASKRCVYSVRLWQTEEEAQNGIDKNDNEYLATLRVKL